MGKRGFVIHHNGPPANCVGNAHTRCVAFWNAVRNYHVDTKGWSDIAYSFGVCPHRILFTGRGWFRNQWANGTDVVGPNDGKDSEWYTVLAFLGGDEKPTVGMVEGVRALIADGRRHGYCGSRVLPHNAFKVKACPGPEFTALAAVWDNTPLPGGSLTVPTPRNVLSELTASQQQELYVRTVAIHEHISRLDPFPPETLNASGSKDANGVPAARTVRWAAETVTLARREAAAIKAAVVEALKDVKVDVDADVVADTVLAKLKAAL